MEKSHVLAIYINHVGIGTRKTCSVQYIYCPLNKLQGKGKFLNPVTNGNCCNLLMIIRKCFEITGKEKEGIITEQLKK